MKYFNECISWTYSSNRSIWHFTIHWEFFSPDFFGIHACCAPAMFFVYLKGVILSVFCSKAYTSPHLSLSWLLISSPVAHWQNSTIDLCVQNFFLWVGLFPRRYQGKSILHWRQCQQQRSFLLLCTSTGHLWRNCHSFVTNFSLSLEQAPAIKFKESEKLKENKNKLFQKGPRDWIWILLEVTRVMGVMDDHLLEARPSRWSFARCQILRMIICKWPVPSVDHLQVAGSSGWSIASWSGYWWSTKRKICRKNAK